MIFTKTPIEGLYVIDIEPRGDDRGIFARTFCEKEFGAQGLKTHFVQNNTSFNVHKGTLRGLHYQFAPSAEVKVVRAVRGALWDVALDMRPGSPTFGRWHGVELSQENRRAFYLPEGMAHGFITLEDATEAAYMASAAYAPDLERGVRWDDPKFKIEWPLEPRTMSDKDAAWRDFDPSWHLMPPAGVS
jgi:dTDP-4-dehydrorhamnose 3,5-epimerase